MISAGTTTLAYDFENRLTTITYPSTATNTFTYNGLDTRVGKVDSGGTKTYKRDGVGVTSPVLADGAATYTPGLSERRSSTSTFSHSGIKNSHEQTASNQSSAATHTYDAFGNLVGSSGTWKGPFGYGGAFGYQNRWRQRPQTPRASLLRIRQLDGSSREIQLRMGNLYAYSGINPVGSPTPPGL